MSIRQRVVSWIVPTARPASRQAGSFVYLIGPDGIKSVDGASTGNPLTDKFYDFLTGKDTQFTNTPQDYARAFKASVWTFKCVRTRGRTLAAIPLEFVDGQGNPAMHPLSYALSQRNTRLMYVTECDMQVYGQAFWRFGIKQGQGWIQRLNPQTIEIVAGVAGVEGYAQRIDGQLIGEWAATDVTHFHDYDPENDLGGAVPMSAALNAVGVTVSISAFAEYFFSNGAMPSGILVAEARMSDVDKKRVLAEWRRQFQGVDKAHGTALLDGGRITYQPITPPLKDLAMVELREEERRDICAAFDVPLSIAQAADPALYAAKQDYANFHTLAILPELDLLLDIINTQMVPQYGVADVVVRANLNDVDALQEDRAEITQRNAQGVSAGYLSLNTALEREGEDPLKTDYLIIGGKLVPKQMLDDGDLDSLRDLGILGQSQQLAPAFPFLSLPEPQKAFLEPRIIDQPPTRAQVDIVVRGQDDGEAQALRHAVLKDTLLQDLARWQRKAAKRGPDVVFSPDYLPSALTDWLRADLLAWDGETDREVWIKAAFTRAEQLVCADGDDDLATPEEFEAYWRGIGELLEGVAGAVLAVLETLPGRLAQALRESGQAGAEVDLAAFLSAQEPALIEALAGDDGPLSRVVLAGAARGNDLLIQAKSAKAEGLTIDWKIIDEYARQWAREQVGTQVRGINQMTLEIFRTKIDEWIEAGGTLEDLAKYIEGDLTGLDIPDGWSPGKIEWATSRERARLIAQTETTAAFHEGAVTRWEQAEVPQKRFRTQNDAHVDDDICRKLNNLVTTLRGLWTHPNGKQYGIPAHPGCRCFAAPAGL